jgi:hypothetical protein
MEREVISMAGAAWLASVIRSHSTKSEFIKHELKGSAFIDKTQSTRAELLGQVYDLAVPPTKKKIVTK